MARARVCRRHEAGSDATTRAGTVSPPMNSTLISSIAWTTWAAVITLPSAEISTPDPISPKRTWPDADTSRPLDRITTTEGLTRRKTSPTGCAAAGAGTTSVAKPPSRSSAMKRPLMPDLLDEPPTRWTDLPRLARFRLP
jgi:hypothetical protein